MKALAQKPITDSGSFESDDFSPKSDNIQFKSLTTYSIYHKKGHVDIKFENLPPFGDNTLESKEELFLKKLQICCVQCDYTDADADLVAKRVKSNALNEILSVISNPINDQYLTECVVDQLFLMIEANLFRVFPDLGLKYFFNGDEPIVNENSWPHLSIVYQILFKFQNFHMNDKHFTNQFLSKILSLFNSPDTNERNFVFQFLSSFTNPNISRIVLKQSTYFIISYIDGYMPPFCVSPFLKVFMHYYKIPNSQYFNELKDAFFYGLLPIIHSPHYMIYDQQIVKIIDMFLQRDASYSLTILNYFLKHWPVLSPSKQIGHLKIIIIVCEYLSSSDFSRICEQLFRFFASCTKSHINRVSEISFRMWHNIHIIPHILENTKYIFPIVFGIYNTLCREHPEPSVRNTCYNALKAMHDIDPYVYDDVSKKKAKEKKSNQPPSLMNQSQRAWAMIARSASTNDKSIELASILANIQCIGGNKRLGFKSSSYVFK